MIKTRTVTDRRQLKFDSLDDILADVESLDGSSVAAVGNWTPAQIVQHVDKVIGGSIDGFDFSLGLPMRIFGRLLRKSAMLNPMKPGFNIPGAAQLFVPDESVAWDDAVASMRSHVERVRSGARMDKTSPFFGVMSQDDWTKLHCRHAEMHLGFLDGGA